MKTRNQTPQIVWDGLIVVVVIALSAMILFLLFKAIISLLSDIDSDIAKAIITSSATIFLAAITLIISKRIEHKARLREEIRQKKIPAYEALISMIFEFMFSDKIGKKKPLDHKLVKTFLEFTQKALVWGSEDVIKAYSRFRNAGWGTLDTEEMKRIYEELLKAIRKDLGHSDSTLPEGMLLSLFINPDKDIDGGQPGNVDDG